VKKEWSLTDKSKRFENFKLAEQTSTTPQLGKKNIIYRKKQQQNKKKKKQQE